MYRALRPDLIESTVEALHEGLAHHFPGSGLSKVVAEVQDVARNLEQRAQWIRPSLAVALRGAVGLMVLGIVGALAWLGPVVAGLGAVRSLAEFMEAAESGLQLLLLLGATTDQDPAGSGL